MIDVEYDVFDYVYPYVSALLPEGGFKSMYVPSPPVLPHATLVEMDNYTNTYTLSTADEEEFAALTYEAQTYAYDKATCRQTMAAICTAMHNLGFIRISMRFIENLNDPTIFRMVARFRALANADKTIFRAKY